MLRPPPRPPLLRPSRCSVALACVLAPLAGAACTSDTGVLQLNWVFVDAQLETIYPSGYERDSCDLVGRVGDDERLFDLRTRVRLSDPDCPGGPGDPECRLIDPLAFPCNRARATEMEIPASADPVRIDVDVVVVPRGGGAFVPKDECLTHPGPRQRAIPEGLVTDLAVYQMVVHAMDPEAQPSIAGRFDLWSCDARNDGMEPP